MRGMWHSNTRGTTSRSGPGCMVLNWSRLFHYYLPDRFAHAAHSIYFQVLGDDGFVGLGIYLVILVAAFLKCFEHHRGGAQTARAEMGSRSCDCHSIQSLCILRIRRPPEHGLLRSIRPRCRDAVAARGSGFAGRKAKAARLGADIGLETAKSTAHRPGSKSGQHSVRGRWFS